MVNPFNISFEKAAAQKWDMNVYQRGCGENYVCMANWVGFAWDHVLHSHHWIMASFSFVINPVLIHVFISDSGLVELGKIIETDNHWINNLWHICPGFGDMERDRVKLKHLVEE